MKNNIVVRNIGLIIILIINLSLVLTNHTLFGESQKSWVATKYFFENYKFINSTFGPLYIFYQKVLLVFNFPVFVKLEIIINSFFFITTMYFLLNIFFKKYETSLIIFCYLPNILLIESRLNLLAASFFLIYLYKLIKYKKTSFLPIELIIACLIGRTFLLLLLINFFIKVFFELKEIKFTQIYSRSSILKIFLIFFLIFSYFNQWSNSKNNHMLSETKYYPNINYKNPLEVGFFQFNNQYHANKKNIGNKDWYFTFPEIYEENNSLKKVLLNKPNFLFEHIIRNFPQLIHNMSVNQIYSLSLKKMNNLVVNKKINYSIRVFLIIISFFFIIKGFLFFFKKNYIKDFKYFVIVTIYLLIFFLTLLIVNPTTRYISLISPILIIFYFVGVREFFKKNFFYFILLFSLSVGTLNFLYFKNYSSNFNIYYEKNLINFIKNKVEFKNFDIFTNEKNLLMIIDQSKTRYMGFDEVPPYFNKEIFNKIKQSNFIIFSDNAKEINDISTKQFVRYENYIKPFVNNKNWKLVNLGYFKILNRIN